MSRVIAGLELVLAFASALFVVVGVSLFPEYQLILSLILIIYGGLLYCFPFLWPYVLVFVSIAVNLAPWTGRYVIDEFDFFIAVTCAILLLKYIRTSIEAPKTFVLPLAYVSLVLVSGFDSSWQEAFGPSYANFYFTDLNGLVVAKGPFWALMLTWLFFKQLKLSKGSAFSHLQYAIVLGAITLFVIILWERQVIPLLISDADIWAKLNKISDFTSAYRSTGLIAGMHTGGESTDGIYVTFLPFVFTGLLFAATKTRKVITFFALGGLLYCILVGFTRITYAASATSLIVCLLVYIFAKQREMGEVRFGVQHFIQQYWKLILSIFFMMVGTFGAYKLAGYYAVFAGGGVVFSFLLVNSLFFAEKVKRNILLFLVSLFYLGIVFDSYADSQWVQFNDNNTIALIVSSLFMLVASLHCFMNIKAPGLVKLPTKTLSLSFGYMLAAFVLVTAVGSARISIRAETTSQDYLGRLEHWTSVINSGEWSLNNTLFGQGAGSFPRNYAFSFPERINEIGYADFSGGKLGFKSGADLMIGQRIEGMSVGLYQLTLRYQGLENVNANVAICRRNLMIFERWAVDCNGEKVRLTGSSNGSTVTVNIENTKKESYLNLPSILTISSNQKDTFFSVNEVSLKKITGDEMILNGNFEQGMDHWYFYYNFEHLAWHIKNLYVSQFYQFGIFGCFLFFALYFLAIKNIESSGNNNLIKVALSGVLMGYLVLGTFGDPLDSARAATWFFIAMFTCQLNIKNGNNQERKDIEKDFTDY